MITGIRLSSHVERVKAELGPTNSRRLAKFPGITSESDGRFALSKVFETLFPGQEKSKALESFKKFRQSVNQASEVAECSLRILVDESKTGRLADRHCWFEAKDSDNPDLQKFAKESSRLADVKGGQKSPALASRPAYRIFVSYAHDDAMAVGSLLDLLKKSLKAQSLGKPYDIDLWIDHNILPGNTWLQEIQTELESSHVGLVFLSQAALASNFIRNEEVPKLMRSVSNLGELRVCIPLMLKNFSFDLYEDALGQLKDRQIYRYKHTNHRDYAWDQCAKGPIKNGYADTFVQSLLIQLDKIHDHRGKETAEESLEKCAWENFAEAFAKDSARHSEKILGNERSTGKPGNLKQLVSRSEEGDSSRSEAVVAADYLMDWVTKSPTFNSEFIAVLGEFGIGKTTTLHQFAQKLIGARKHKPSLPLPLLFDLRAYQKARKERDEITLESILNSCLRSVRNTEGITWKLTADEIIRSVRQQGAVAIFDGLDEVMNALGRSERQKFVSELWSILPPAPAAADGKPPERPEGRGRIIMSCRSHFFRDVTEQNGIFTGQGRENIEEEDRLCLTILPFTHEQIRSYMRSCLGTKRGDGAFEQLQEIHNLLDLAKRPVLLNMIREIVPELEDAQRRGEVIQGVDLYERFLKKHMDRDEGKHVFTVQHKLRIMEALAADLWISGVREWEWGRLEEWLDDFLRLNPSISNRYHVDAETLNQDFRNATAVVRPAGEKSHFRFAHTSLQEYFLACWMSRSLSAGTLEKWPKLGTPSNETLDFLGQLLAKSRDSKALEQLAALMETPHGDANMIGFSYLILAQQSQYPLPQPLTVHLERQHFYRWKIQGRSESEPLILKNLKLTGANLAESQWKWVSFEQGDFRKTTLTQTVWKSCSFRRSIFGNSKAEGARFYECSWEQPVFDEADCWKGVWLSSCRGFPDRKRSPHAVLSGDHPVLCQLAQRLQYHGREVISVAYDLQRGRYVSGSYDWTLKIWDAESLACLGTIEGHRGWIFSVAYDAERGRYVSGSSDNTVKIWDAESLACLGTLVGHRGWIFSVAYDAERGRYVSGSSDNTVKIWDAESLACLGTLVGHRGVIRSVAYDAKRGRYISGSDDKALKIWDAESFECLGSLVGHGSWIMCVAYDSERSRYVSGSDDRTMKIWDAESLTCLGTLVGHGGWIMSVACDAQQGRYVSGSSDKTLKIWDAESLACLGTLKGHWGLIRSVMYNSERRCYVSGSDDQTLKIWDAESLTCLSTFAGHGNWVMSVTHNPERGCYVSGSSDNTVKIWDADSLACLGTLEGHRGWIFSVAYDAERGRYVSGSDDLTLKIWDADSLACVGTLEGHRGRISSVAYDAERGRYVSGSSDNTVKIWDADSLACLGTLVGHRGGILSVAYDAERGCYVSGSDDLTLKIWDADSLACVGTLEGHRGRISSVAYDVERSRYVSGSDDLTLKIWDADSLACVGTLEGHQGRISSVAYDAERSRYVSGSSDNTMKIWDAESLACVGTLVGHGGWISSVAYDAERGRYVNGSSDNTVKIWDAESNGLSGEILPLPEGQWASLSPPQAAPVAMSERAGEFLMWVTREGTGRRLKAFPFGEISTSSRKA